MKNVFILLTLLAALLLPRPALADYYLVGSFNSWNNGAADCRFSPLEGDAEYTFVLEKQITNGDEGFLITDGSWDNKWGANEYKVTPEIKYGTKAGGGNMRFNDGQDDQAGWFYFNPADGSMLFTTTKRGSTTPTPTPDAKLFYVGAGTDAGQTPAEAKAALEADNCYYVEVKNDGWIKISTSSASDWNSFNAGVIVPASDREGFAVTDVAVETVKENDDIKCTSASGYICVSKDFKYIQHVNDVADFKIPSAGETLTSVTLFGLGDWANGKEFSLVDGVWTLKLAEVGANQEFKISTSKGWVENPAISGNVEHTSGSNIHLNADYTDVTFTYTEAGGLTINGTKKQTVAPEIEAYLSFTGAWGENGVKFEKIVGHDGFDYVAYVPEYYNFESGSGKGFAVYRKDTGKNWQAAAGSGANNVKVNGEAFTMTESGAILMWALDATDGNPYYFYYNPTDNKVLITTERRSEPTLTLEGNFDNGGENAFVNDDATAVIKGYTGNAGFGFVASEEAGYTVFTTDIETFTPMTWFRFVYNGKHFGPLDYDNNEAVAFGREVLATQNAASSFTMKDGVYTMKVYVKDGVVEKFTVDQKQARTNYFTSGTYNGTPFKLYLRGGRFGWTKADSGNELTRVDVATDTDLKIDAAEDDLVFRLVRPEGMAGGTTDFDPEIMGFKIGTGEEKGWMWGFTTWTEDMPLEASAPLSYNVECGCPAVTGEGTNMWMEENRTDKVVVEFNLSRHTLLIWYGDDYVDYFDNGVWMHISNDGSFEDTNAIEMTVADEEYPGYLVCQASLAPSQHFIFASDQSLANAHRFAPVGQGAIEFVVSGTPDELDNVNLRGRGLWEVHPYAENFTHGTWQVREVINEKPQTSPESRAETTNNYDVAFHAATGQAFLVRSTTTGIETVDAADADAPAIYFNLQGVQVANPEAGQIYIVKKGNTVSKQLMR